MKCRHCKQNTEDIFLDLGFSPPSNSFRTEKNLKEQEIWYPLKTYFCKKCLLVQTEDFKSEKEIFDENYPYFSSISSTWSKHCEKLAYDMITSLNLGTKSFVVEIACNDGCLIKNFFTNSIPCLGIEPTKSTASRARDLGINVEESFFGEELSKSLETKYGSADLIIGNNVYAHVPDINDFTRGLKLLLKSEGTIILEFPHLFQLIRKIQFDTIYHEHYSYLSLFAVCKIFSKFGLRVFNVEELSTHGGSLRVFGCHFNDRRITEASVFNLLDEEKKFGLKSDSTLADFKYKVENIKDSFLSFLIEQKYKGKKVMAYGAAAKGNTILNYAGIKSDLIHAVFDASSSKQGKYLPGSHIFIEDPKHIKLERPEFIVILPWNIKEEISEQLGFIRQWGGKFVTTIPKLEIF